MQKQFDALFTTGLSKLLDESIERRSKKPYAGTRSGRKDQEHSCNILKLGESYSLFNIGTYEIQNVYTNKITTKLVACGYLIYLLNKVSLFNDRHFACGLYNYLSYSIGLGHVNHMASFYFCYFCI